MSFLYYPSNPNSNFYQIPQKKKQIIVLRTMFLLKLLLNLITGKYLEFNKANSKIYTRSSAGNIFWGTC